MTDSIITLHDFGVAYDRKTVLEGINTSITIILISLLTIWLCPCVESSLVLLEEGLLCLLWPVHSLVKTLLAFALLHSSLNLPVTPGVS